MRVLKTAGIVAGALAAGGAFGFVCDKVGVSTTTAVAIVVAGFGAFSYENRKKTAVKAV